MIKSLHGTCSDKVIHIKSKMACPIKQKNGDWKVVLKPYEEDIPDLGREELICNKCGWPNYPQCKETFCKVWINKSKTKR